MLHGWALTCLAALRVDIPRCLALLFLSLPCCLAIQACFKLQYDVLVMAVGSVNNTFGIQGVQEYCNFFKTIEDASALRRRVSECFERAALPYIDQEQRRRLLSFVVCGGGPTGVEVAAELYDMVSASAWWHGVAAHAWWQRPLLLPGH